MGIRRNYAGYSQHCHQCEAHGTVARSAKVHLTLKLVGGVYRRQDLHFSGLLLFVICFVVVKCSKVGVPLEPASIDRVTRSTPQTHNIPIVICALFKLYYKLVRHRTASNARSGSFCSPRDRLTAASPRRKAVNLGAAAALMHR